MDDNRFDDIIKGKIGEYEDPQFDPAALDALHARMDTIGGLPWYSRFRNELLVATGLITLSIILLWTQRNILLQNTLTLENEIERLKYSQTEQLNELQNEITSLKALPPDTVRIVEIREIPVTIYASTDYETSRALPDSQDYPSSILLGKEDEIPEELYDQLFINGLIQKDGEMVYLVNRGDSEFIVISKIAPGGEFPEDGYIHLVFEEGVLLNEEEKSSTPISVQTLRDIEKHYSRGVGIKVGPTAETSTGIYSNGTGHFDIGGGVLGDFIMSPSISLETGMKQQRRRYEVGDPIQMASMNLPGLDPSLGVLESVDVESIIFDVPLNLKYRYPISLRTYWNASVGYSFTIFRKQDFEYSHLFSGPSDSDVTLNTSEEIVGLEVYPGIANVSLGIAHELKNKKILEIGLYYKRALGELGYENANPSFVGLKGVYWFTVR